MSVNWPLNEWQLVLATAICLDVVILVLIVTVLRKTKVSRAECARLGQDVKQLAEDIKGLLASGSKDAFSKKLMAQRKTTIKHHGSVKWQSDRNRQPRARG